jgi:hypothetical protein
LTLQLTLLVTIENAFNVESGVAPGSALLPAQHASHLLEVARAELLLLLPLLPLLLLLPLLPLLVLTCSEGR